MSFRKIVTLAVLGGVTLGLIGCGGSKGANDPFADSSEGIKPVSGFYGEHMSSEEELGLLNKKIVYFAYDSNNLTQADMRLLNVHAKYLLDHPKLDMRIAGHTDERGSREYNIALGQRRADAVARYLESKGVPANRLHTISYGKEQPVDLGSGEQAWAQNRRAVLEYEDK
jgi:peptidoglycan-associated lipoprotein